MTEASLVIDTSDVNTNKHEQVLTEVAIRNQLFSHKLLCNDIIQIESLLENRNVIMHDFYNNFHFGSFGK